MEQHHHRKVLDIGNIRDNGISIKLPTTDTELRNTYLSEEHSIMQNFPMPKVHVLNNHSYVSVKESIANFLLSGGKYLKQGLDVPYFRTKCIVSLNLNFESHTCKSCYR